jgi:FtsZ-interacting cell division protein YlmF
MNEEIKKGLKPAFIAKNRKVYSMLFVTPEQYTETRKILDELGVGEPKLK